MLDESRRLDDEVVVAEAVSVVMAVVSELIVAVITSDVLELLVELLSIAVIDSVAELGLVNTEDVERGKADRLSNEE